MCQPQLTLHQMSYPLKNPTSKIPGPPCVTMAGGTATTGGVFDNFSVVADQFISWPPVTLRAMPVM